MWFCERAMRKYYVFPLMTGGADKWSAYFIVIYRINAFQPSQNHVFYRIKAPMDTVSLNFSRVFALFVPFFAFYT